MQFLVVTEGAAAPHPLDLPLSAFTYLPDTKVTHLKVIIGHGLTPVEMSYKVYMIQPPPGAACTELCVQFCDGSSEGDNVMVVPISILKILVKKLQCRKYFPSGRHHADRPFGGYVCKGFGLIEGNNSRMYLIDPASKIIDLGCAHHWSTYVAFSSALAWGERAAILRVAPPLEIQTHEEKCQPFCGASVSCWYGEENLRFIRENDHCLPCFFK